MATYNGTARTHSGERPSGDEQCDGSDRATPPCPEPEPCPEPPQGSPVVSVVSPAEGSLIARDAVFHVRVENDFPLRIFVLAARYASGLEETICAVESDSADFLPRFGEQGSYLETDHDPPSSYRWDVHVERRGDWPVGPLQFFVRGADTTGVGL